MTRDEETLPIETLLAHRDWVRRIARRLVADESRADDLEQEVWVRAMTSPPRHGRALRAWLGTVLRNTAGKMRRGELRRGRREDLVRRPEAVDPVAEATAHGRVVRAVLDLDEPYRTAILLRYFRSLSIRETAERTGAPLETTRTRLKRGMARLRERLAPEDGPDRRRLRALLGPLLPAGGLATGVGSTSAPALTAGAVVMSLRVKLTLLALLLLLLGGGSLLLLASPASPRAPAAPAPGAPSVAAADAGDRAAPAEETVAPAPGAVRLRGKVVGPDGRPAEGVTVKLLRHPPFGGEPETVAVARSGPGGGYRVPEVPAGLYSVSLVTAEGVEVRGYVLHLPLAGAVTFALPETGTVAGRVLTKETGKPVEGASVIVGSADPLQVLGRGRPRLSGEARTVTDAAGRFEVRGLPRGCLTDLTVRAPGLVTFRGSWLPLQAERLGDRIDRTVRLEPRATIRVRVRGEEGEPVADARVDVLVDVPYAEPVTVRAEDGRAVVRPEFAGPTSIRVRAKGYRPVVATAPAEGHLSFVRPGEDVSIDVDLERLGPGKEEKTGPTGPRPGPLLSGRVLGPDGRPAVGARVGVTWAKQTPIQCLERAADVGVGAEGEFEIRAPRGGELTLFARADGMAIGTLAVTTYRDRSGRELRLAPEAPIEGVVRDESGGAVSDALVYVYALGAAIAATDETGRFRIGGAPPGPVKLWVRAPGFAEARLTADAGGAPVDVVLRRGVPIRGRVVAEDGEPVAARPLWVTVTHPDGTWARWPAEADGRFETFPLDPDVDWFVWAVGPDGYIGTEPLTARPGGGPVRLVLLEGHSIAGRIVDEEGRPVPAGVPVDGRAVDRQEKEFGGNFRAKTGADGRFAVERKIGVFRWRLVVGGDGSDWIPTEQEGTFPSDATDLRLVARRGVRVEGRLLDARGEPAADATVGATWSGADRTPSVKTDRNGAFSLRGLPRGAVTIRVWRDGGWVRLRTVSAPGSGLELRLP